MMSDKKRVLWLDITKIIACFLVIINHTHRQLFVFAGETASTVLFESFLFAICKCAVPLFVMVSGYLLLPRQITYRSMLKRACLIAVPLLAISICYYIVPLDTSRSVSNFIGLFIQAPQSVVLWYLYMLLGLYAATPFISKMIQHFETKDYAIFIGLFLLLPAIKDLFVLVTGYAVSDFFFNAFFQVAQF